MTVVVPDAKRRLTRLPLLLGLCLSWLLAPHASAQAAECRAGDTLEREQLLVLDFRDFKKRDGQRGLDAGQYRLGNVEFVRQNVFPQRDHWLARQANRFNILTRESALLAAFPLQEGDTFGEVQRKEAERVMRDKPYLYDALVLVRQICGDVVDLDVVVRDVWTLAPSVGVRRSGGDNETSASLSDLNVLGTGKSISVSYFDDNDRSGTFLRYDDPNIAGSRWAGGFTAADNDDGERYSLDVGRPFFALDTEFSFGFAVDHFLREQDLEFLSKDQFELDAKSDAANIFVALSRGRTEGWVNRFYAGARYLDETYDFPANFPGPLRTERTFAYPYLGWQLLQDKYVERTDVDRVGITEDIKLGWSSYAEVGWSTDGFGGEGDYLLARGSAGYRQYFGPRHLLSLGAQFVGRYDLDEDDSEDVEFSARAAYLWHQARKWRFLASLDYVQTRDLPLDKQLTLGGDSGLRGYPNAYQVGDRSFQVTLEQRYYSNAYPLGLLRVGYAVFVDVGRAWFEDEPPAWVPDRRGDHFGNLADVGFGIRLESIRTRRDRVLHVDIAKPLVDGPFVDSWEFTIIAKQAL